MLLGARQSLWRGGRLSAKSYVQSGLIAQWDGIENAGYGEHDSNAKVWKDLKGRHILESYGSPVFSNNSVNLDRVSWFECDAQDFIDPLNSGKITIEFVFRNLENAGGNKGFYAFGRDRGVWLFTTIYPDFVLQIKGKGVYRDSQTLENLTDMSITCNSSSVFINGTKKGDIIGSGSPVSNYRLAIGRMFYGPDDISEENVYTARVYNRTLTPEEVTHNYQIDKERFGI